MTFLFTAAAPLRIPNHVGFDDAGVGLVVDVVDRHFDGFIMRLSTRCPIDKANRLIKGLAIKVHGNTMNQTKQAIGREILSPVDDGMMGRDSKNLGCDSRMKLLRRFKRKEMRWILLK
mmetsp:Transcript_13951/g.28835  ORF Transcript_13951/g.28835 Transcript_13951/m.28835 type:complete len:118 (-) Transcript_13951:120-473(-)